MLKLALFPLNTFQSPQFDERGPQVYSQLEAASTFGDIPPFWIHQNPAAISAYQFVDLCRIATCEHHQRSALVPEKRRSDYVESFLNGEPGNPARLGDLLLLPRRIDGKLLIVFDLHGDYESYALAASKFMARVAAGQDVFLLFTGDYIRKNSGSVKILKELLQLFTHPLYGERVLMLKGNHEWKGHREYQVDGGTGPTRCDFLKNIEKSFGREFGPLQSVSPADVWNAAFDFFDGLPHAAATSGGALLMHGGIGTATTRALAPFNRTVADRRRAAIKLFAEPDGDVREELLKLKINNKGWEFGARKRVASPSQMEQALDYSGFKLIIRGHQVPEQCDRGWVATGGRIFTGHSVTWMDGKEYADSILGEIGLGDDCRSVDDITPQRLREKSERVGSP